MEKVGSQSRTQRRRRCPSSGDLLETEDVDAGIMKHMTMKRSRGALDEDEVDREAQSTFTDFPQQLKALRERSQQQQMPLQWDLEGEVSMDLSLLTATTALPSTLDGGFMPPPVLRREGEDVSCSGWQQSFASLQQHQRNQQSPQNTAPRRKLQTSPKRRLLIRRDTSVRSYKSLNLSSSLSSSTSSGISLTNAGSTHSAKSLPLTSMAAIESPHRARQLRQRGYRQPLRRTRSREAVAA